MGLRLYGGMSSDIARLVLGLALPSWIGSWFLETASAVKRCSLGICIEAENSLVRAMRGGIRT